MSDKRKALLDMCQWIEGMASDQNNLDGRSGESRMDVTKVINALKKLREEAESGKLKSKSESTSIDQGLEDLEIAGSRYKTLVHNSPFCIHEIAVDGKIVSMNPAGLAMVGCSLESEVRGVPYLDYVDPANKPRVRQLMEKAFEGKPQAFKFTTATEFPQVFSSNFIPIKDTSGKVVKLMGLTQDITESTLIEQALSRNREQLRRIIENIGEIVYSVRFADPKDAFSGQIDFLSPQVEKLLGYPVSEFETNQGLWFSLLHPDDIPAVLEQTKNLIQSKKGVTRIYRLMAKTRGEHLWFEDKVTPEMDENGDVIGYYGSARDITVRMKAEQALRDSEEKYRNLFEKSPVGIGLTNIEGDLIAFNDAILIPGGYTREDVEKIGNVGGFYYSPEDRQKIRKEFMAKGVLDRKEVRYKKKDGSPYFASLSLTQILIEGKPGIMAMVRDITDRKIAEEELRKSEERNKIIVENVFEAILLLDPVKKRFLGSNQNAVKLFGFDTKTLLKMGPKDLTTPIQPDGRTIDETVVAETQKALKGENPVFEQEFVARDGRHFHGEIRLTSIPYEDQKIVMVSIEDISHRKSMEEERENLIRELDRFVYSASHDMSAPLKSIRGLLNVARIESTEDSMNIYFDKIEQSIKKLEDFIGDIILYSRNSRLEVQSEKIDLQELVDSIIDDLRYGEGFDKIEIIKDMSKLKSVTTDKFRLRIVLNNLISNAIKFHQVNLRENPWVKITSFKKGGKSHIEIADNGIGMSKKVLDSIFDMFYRGSLDSKGSGLGLYIAKESAQNINGKLQVTSESGKGSAFTLVLGHDDVKPRIRSKIEKKVIAGGV